MSLSRVNTIAELKQRAHRRLPRILFDYIEGGAGDERAIADATAQFNEIRIVPRRLVDVSRRSTSTKLFGGIFDFPFGIAPVGFAGAFWPRGEEALARISREANIPMILSSSSVASVESLAEVAGGNLWFQVYVAKDREITNDMLRRAEAAGVKTVVLTVDIPVLARRNRNVRNGFRLPLKITPSLAADVLAHPKWLFRYVASGGMPVMGNWARYAGPQATPKLVADTMRVNVDTPLTWSDVREIRDRWTGHLVIKGVLHAGDVDEAIAAGADGIVVSNHGGRQCDRLPSTLQVLPGIVNSARDRLAVMFDGGISSGADVLIALSLGAEFVFAGRAPIWGLAAGGYSGARHAVKILGEELDNALGQVGATSIREAMSLSLVHPS